jgi:hypothetical protein
MIGSHVQLSTLQRDSEFHKEDPFVNLWFINLFLIELEPILNLATAMVRQTNASFRDKCISSLTGFAKVNVGAAIDMAGNRGASSEIC